MSAALTRVSALVGELEATVDAFAGVDLTRGTQAARAHSLAAYAAELEQGIAKLRPALTDAAQAELFAQDLEAIDEAIPAEEWAERLGAPQTSRGGLP